MERTTLSDVKSAFRELVSIMGVKSGNELGEFRIGYDGYGRVRIEQIINNAGAIHVMSPGMTKREFTDSVYFLRNALLTKENPNRYVDR